MRKDILLIFLLFSVIAKSQVNFDRALNIPVTVNGATLRFPWAGGINFPLMSTIDLNDDGKKDLFLFDHQNNRIMTFLNNGGTTYDVAWDYAPDFAYQFPPANKWVYLYDYNCDGKEDFFTSSSKAQCSGIALYKNISPPGGPLQWTIVDSCMDERFVNIHEHIFSNAIALPHFNDVDGDGDMDILGYNTTPNGYIMYHKNYSMEDYGVCDSLDFVLETQCYGNFALKIGGTNSVGCFHCPCRIRRPYNPLDGRSSEEYYEINETPYEEPSRSQTDAAKRDDTVSSIYALDLDGDGNKELLFGDIASNNTLMVHNGGVDMDYQDTLFPSGNPPGMSAYFNGFHYHAYIDVDNDGVKDLIVMPYEHENVKGMWLYKNTGNDSVPIFNFETDVFLQGQMIDAGEDVCPVFYDYDNDNLQDLIISKTIFDPTNGSYKTGLYLYKNTGSLGSPSFDLITNDFANLTGSGLYSSPIYPAFGDLDGDGDKDMLIGRQDGKLYYYTNNGGNFTGPVPNYMSIDVGQYASPQLYDVNHDGKLDIICGGQRGFVNYFTNRGTTSAALYDSIPTNDSLGCIVLQGAASPDGFTVPFMYDSLGFTRLVVSNENGNVYQYTNIDGNLTGCFTLADSVYDQSETSRIRFNVTVSGADLNGDSLVDLIIGHSTGGAEIRYQRNPHAGIKQISEVKPSFEIFPNPVIDNLSIRFYNLSHRETVIRIFNSIGKIVKEKIIDSERTEIKTAGFSAGIYFVQMSSGKYVVGKKLIVRGQ